LHDVPCILVTSRDAPEDRRRAEAVGASAYIVKSEFNQVEFLDRVATLVQR
jgi:two-component system chemotaxis sensor kinase CheA